jgi:hypothetical protein
MVLPTVSKDSTATTVRVNPVFPILPSLPALSLTTLLHTHGPWGRLRVIPLGCTKLVPFGFLRDPLIIALAAIITIKKTGPVTGFILDS